MSRPAVARRHVLELILAAACWGVGTAVSKQAVSEVPPLTLLVAQLLVSLGVLGLVARRRGERLPRSRDGMRLARLGLLNPGLAYALSLLGLAQISASLSVLLWALEPVLILILAVVVLRERPGMALVVLSAVAVGGLVLVLYDPAASGAVPGMLLTLAGVGCCAVYTVATRRWLPGVDSTLGVVVAQQAHALGFAGIVLLASAAGGVAVLPATLTAAGIVSTVLSGLIYYGLAYAFYLSGLRWVPASVAAVSFYLIPVFGVGAATLLGDRLAPAQWIGAAVVVIAVGLITVRSASADAPAEPQPPAAPVVAATIDA
jgi:probable blue pigment (indigoidine) exporter